MWVAVEAPHRAESPVCSGTLAPRQPGRSPLVALFRCRTAVLPGHAWLLFVRRPVADRDRRAGVFDAWPEATVVGTDRPLDDVVQLAAAAVTSRP